MRVFLTGATGFIGSHVITELQRAGHHVIGLIRSEAGAKTLEAKGVEPFRGTLEDPASLAGGTKGADAVIHTAFDHTFTDFVASCDKDARVIAALGGALKGSKRPLIITSGPGMGDMGDGQLATEDNFNPDVLNPRKLSEVTGNSLLREGIDVRVMRLPQVHDRTRQGLVTPYIDIARTKGVAAYVGEGDNRWAAAHVSDVARLYVLALENGISGERYHAVDEEGVSCREIAEAVAKGLGVTTVSIKPEDAQEHFGWFGLFAGMDMSASSRWTRQRLAWQPTSPGLINDLINLNFRKET